MNKRCIHFKASSSVYRSPCGEWKPGIVNVAVSTALEDVSCVECIGLTLIRRWKQLSTSAQVAIRRAMNRYEGLEA